MWDPGNMREGRAAHRSRPADRHRRVADAHNWTPLADPGAASSINRRTHA